MLYLDKDGIQRFSLGGILPPDGIAITPAAAALKASLDQSVEAAKKTIAELEPILKKKYGLDFFGVTKK